jgi:hypothetical protein
MRLENSEAWRVREANLEVQIVLLVDVLDELVDVCRLRLWVRPQDFPICGSHDVSLLPNTKLYTLQIGVSNAKPRSK